MGGDALWAHVGTCVRGCTHVGGDALWAHVGGDALWTHAHGHVKVHGESGCGFVRRPCDISQFYSNVFVYVWLHIHGNSVDFSSVRVHWKHMACYFAALMHTYGMHKP